MISIKGFVEIPSFANNAAGEVAPLGELSAISKSYSTEIGIYTSSTHPYFNFRVFSSRDESEVNVAPSGHQIDVAFLVVGMIYDRMLSNNTSDRTDLLNYLGTQFAATIEQVDCGPIVSGAYDLPQWISWKLVGEESYYRFWFSDGAFRNQYDLSEIKVTLPIDPPDSFFLSASVVKSRLNAVTPETMIAAMNAKIGNTPQTTLLVLKFEYINPMDPSDKTLAYFGVIIHGWIGNNLDAQKTAIIDAILANSTHTREEWMAILPDLFRRTEFVIVPMFDRYAIPNMTLQAGIYSPVVKPEDIIAYGVTFGIEYPEAHVRQNVGVLSLTYRSLQAAVIGSPENLDGTYDLLDYFPDYITVPSTSPDFNRMALNTQQWALKLSEAVQMAESYNINSEMVSGYSRVRREGVTFMAFSHNNVQYLVPAKSNF